MRSPVPVIATLVAAMLLAQSGVADAQQNPAPGSYRPGLGDLMTMTVQPQHTKLGLAGDRWQLDLCRLCAARAGRIVRTLCEGLAAVPHLFDTGHAENR